jgi:hypothetical protein
MKVNDIVTLSYPRFYSANIEFWERVNIDLPITRFTIGKHNPVVNDMVFDKFTGVCVSHVGNKHVPDCYKKSKILLTIHTLNDMIII